MDSFYPSVLLTLTLAPVYNAAAMFRCRFVFSQGVLAASVSLASYLPVHGDGVLGLPALVQAAMALAVSALALSRRQSMNLLREGLMSVRQVEREQQQAIRRM